MTRQIDHRSHRRLFPLLRLRQYFCFWADRQLRLWTGQKKKKKNQKNPHYQFQAGYCHLRRVIISGAAVSVYPHRVRVSVNVFAYILSQRFSGPQCVKRGCYTGICGGFRYPTDWTLWAGAVILRHVSVAADLPACSPSRSKQRQATRAVLQQTTLQTTAKWAGWALR